MEGIPHGGCWHEECEVCFPHLQGKRRIVQIPDCSEVVRVIEHWLQHGSDAHPYSGHEEAAHALESGDAHRAVIAIGAALDRAKRKK